VGLVCALAAPAWGAPAVVRVFEAQAHEQPDVTSPVLHVFPEDAKLSVSEDASDGWRRVRLPDGRTGFVRDDEIAVAPPPPVQPLPRRNPPAYPPAGRAQADDPTREIRVKDVHHLSALAQDDAVVGPQASGLALRRTAAFGVMFGAIAAGIALEIAGFTVLTKESCFYGGTEPVCHESPSIPAILAGPLLVAGGVLAWLLIKPTRSDVMEVIDAWNARHRDQQFRYVR